MFNAIKKEEINTTQPHEKLILAQFLESSKDKKFFEKLYQHST